MNELAKTMTFVGVAAVMAAVAVGSHFMNRPTNSADFELVGKPFFEEFNSASQAQSLEVVAMDPETARLKKFSVENQDGLWRIPSHSNYPAEAVERLATTATSVMGLERQSLAGRLVKEHERLGVVDPLDESIEDPESAGKRVTLKDAGGEVVVDFIIGKEAGESELRDFNDPFDQEDDEKFYYVRRPDENQTYKVKLDIDLSTKFSDWIDPDLLRLEQNELTKVVINNYSIEEEVANGRRVIFKKPGDILKLGRTSPADSWELEGLAAETEELTNARVNEILGVLDELKIAGVRPKFKYKGHLLLTADLELNQRPEFDPKSREYQAATDQLQYELGQNGFNLAEMDGKLGLVSKYGELTVGTDKGVLYTLHIGDTVEGDETEIEIGSSSSGEAAKKKDGSVDDEKSKEKTDGESKGKTDAKADEATPDDKEADAEAKEEEAEIDNRFLLVRVALDESLITPKPEEPTKPVEPVAPEGYEPAPKEPEKKDDQADDKPESPADEEAPEGVKPPEGEAEEQKKDQRNPEFVKYDEAKKAFDEATVQYELDMTRFKDDTEAFAKKVTEGQKLVDELNERFGDWYYVMSADNLNTLRSQREDLVTKKEPAPGAEPPPSARPDISFPDLPVGGTGAPTDANKQPMKEGEAGAEGEAESPKPNSESPETGESKPETLKPDESAADQPKPEEPMTEEGQPKTEQPKTEDPKTEDPKTKVEEKVEASAEGTPESGEDPKPETDPSAETTDAGDSQGEPKPDS